MNLNSIEYVVFLIVIFGAYYLLPNKFKKGSLLLASLFFYAYANYKFLIYLIPAIIINFFAGIIIEKNKSKSIFIISILLNICFLIFVKYLNFIDEVLSSFKIISNNQNFFNTFIFVPLGLSFITFEFLSYLIDVYRGTINAERNIINFSLFISFFAKVSQGPIEKAKSFISQIESNTTFKIENIKKGCITLLYGLFLKMCIADYLAIIVNTIYGDISNYRGATLAFATISFALQLYFDFYGYSLIAQGSSKLFGIDLIDNFKQPYLSTSVSEFWRKWHISLNVFLRDYIYIPLGGNRVSTIRKHINTLIVFVVSGIWHGASWGYIIWGILNGIYVVLGNLIKDFFVNNSISLNKLKIYKPLKIVWVFALICVSWVFFRAQSFADALEIFRKVSADPKIWIPIKNIIKHIITNKSEVVYGLSATKYIYLFIVVLVGTAIDIFAKIKNKSVFDIFDIKPIWIKWGIVYILIFTVIIFGVYGFGYNAASFVYGQY